MKFEHLGKADKLQFLTDLTERGTPQIVGLLTNA